MSKEDFKKTIQELVEKFNRNIDRYKDQSSSFNETQLRIEFIDPMFESLGWDMNNKAGAAEQYKEVIHEDKVYIEGKPKAPDYSFKFWGERKFFLEAKQPFVKIKTDYKPALQLRRYAWSAHLPVSILSDFEELAIYDTTIEPKATDKASVARLKYYKYTEYLEKWEEIYDLFAKESIQQGSFDKFIAKEKRGSQLVDKVFLKEIENWREWLAKDIAKNNQDVTVEELNFSVQKIIDRIIFLRIAEDRGIEVYKTLEKIIKSKSSYKELVRHFKVAHDKYNSGLFDFEEDTITPELKVTDKLLDKILEHLYYPNSPYEFSVLGVEVLGSIYEQFLGKVIRLTDRHNAKVEEKPEVKKAGGVFYTPQYIVEYIVKNTVGELLKGKSIKQAEKIKVLDPACGSGSFLIGAYEYLLDWHLAEYEKLSGKEKEKLEKKGVIYKQVNKESTRESIESWQLTTNEKKRIMLNNIYGVDIDKQAVEVTKLSLALKMLENENQQSINKQMKLFAERILPDMGGNIKCGNSLVGSDYWEDDNKGLQPLVDASEEEIKKVNAFDWDSEFSDIFKEKELHAHMVTWVTHNSRISERMVRFGVKKGEGIWLEEKAELKITEFIRDIVKDHNIPVISYNICGDHIHMIIVSSNDDLPNIIRKLKGRSAQKYKEYLGVEKTERYHLWAQKYHSKVLDNREEWENAINYIQQNRLKHELSDNKGLQPLVQNMVTTEEQAFSTQYEGGFDAVIGNPPYVRQESIKELKPYLKSKYQTYNGISDLYVYFFEKGMNVLKKAGLFSYIVSDKFTRAGYGKDLRKFITQNHTLVEFTKEFDEKVFENASVDPCIITIQKGRNKDNSHVTVKKGSSRGFIELMKVSNEHLDEMAWNFVSDETNQLIKKIEDVGTKIKEIEGLQINYGIKTGFNEAFVINEAKKNELIAKDPKSAELIKPLLRGRDLGRYEYQHAELYLINSHNGYIDSEGNKIPPVNVQKDYPAIFEYLNDVNVETKGRVEKRYDQGKHWTNLRNCKYIEDFEKPKILYPEIVANHGFVVDLEKLFVNNKIFILTQDKYLYSIAGILNSKLGKLLAQHYCVPLGKSGFEYRKIFIEQIPLVFPEGKKKELFEDLVETQLSNHKSLAKADSETKKQLIQRQIDATDEKINKLVYELYGLTEEEIEIIEG